MAGNLNAAAAAVGRQNMSSYSNTTSATAHIETGPSRALEMARRLVTNDGSVPAPFLNTPMGAQTMPADSSSTNEPRIALNYAAIGHGLVTIGAEDICFVSGVQNIAQATRGETSQRVPGEPLPPGGHVFNVAMANATIGSLQLARLLKKKKEQDQDPTATPYHRRIHLEQAQYRPDVSGDIDEIANVLKPMGCVRDQVGANGGGDVTGFEAGMPSKGYTTRGKLLNIGLAGRNMILNTSRQPITPGDYVMAVLVPRIVHFNEQFVVALDAPPAVVGSTLPNPLSRSDLVDVLQTDRVAGDNPLMKVQTRPSVRSLNQAYFEGIYKKQLNVSAEDFSGNPDQSWSAVIYQWEIYPTFDKVLHSDFFTQPYSMIIDKGVTVPAEARDYRKCIVGISRSTFTPPTQLGDHRLADRIRKTTNLSRNYQEIRAQPKSEIYVFAQNTTCP